MTVLSLYLHDLFNGKIIVLTIMPKKRILLRIVFSLQSIFSIYTYFPESRVAQLLPLLSFFAIFLLLSTLITISLFASVPIFYFPKATLICIYALLLFVSKGQNFLIILITALSSLVLA